MVEVMQEEVIDTLATKDFVKATVELAVERSNMLSGR